MTRRTRHGAALAIAMFALVTMAAIADAVLAPALASRRASRRLAAHAAAEAEAERALGAVVGEWAPSAWRALVSGHESVTVRHAAASRIAASAISVQTRVRRLGPDVFWVAAMTRVPLADAPAAAHRSLLVELVRDSIRLPAALTAGGDINLAAGAALAVGNDCAPANAAPPAALIAHPAAEIRRDGSATDEGGRDTVARSAVTYAAPAGIRLPALLDAASIRLPNGTVMTPEPRESGGQCIHGAANWGGHGNGSCADYSPVVVAEGDLRIRGGGGQGALVVAGRLVIEGPFHYRGLIVAAGGLETTGGAVTIDGAVLTSAMGDATLHG
nr:hypothetical protein [Gemmatimonadaceae bacterium]